MQTIRPQSIGMSPRRTVQASGAMQQAHAQGGACIVAAATQSAFPATGEEGKLYLDISTGVLHRWDGAAYAEVSEPAAIDAGEINDAFQ